ncbi:DUF924 family protein [Rhodanobacter sp. L36]|uniref:DUF924 family protein n=1 Tax=Rhodanobacter sp. L36 TaxID=1747221 RepID=UPI00131C623D|nr:DUF924 family protein [Rhodanobacter sp. L36]
MSPTASDVLSFWFAKENEARWYVADAAFDHEIQRRFGDLAKEAADGRLDDWASTPESWLALLILLDQFSRNLYRNDARAWAQDVKAQRLALSGIAKGNDQALPALQRVFAYMALEHAENFSLQQRSVELFEALRKSVPLDLRHRLDEFLAYAKKHRDVIQRFGRFPHRNAALGRPNTGEEADYLAKPGSSF